MDTSTRALDTAQFLAAFATEFDRDPTGLTPDTGLWDELAFDSFDAVRLILWLEAISDVLVALELPPPLLTVGDAHRHHIDLVGASQQSVLRP